jgi:hypothetical protein
MRRFALLLAISLPALAQFPVLPGVLSSGTSGVTITLVGTPQTSGSATGSSVSTAAANTTGANFFLLPVNTFSVAALAANITATGTGCTWSNTTPQSRGGSYDETLFFCDGPTTGSSQAISYSQTSSLPSIGFAAFSGVLAGAPDVQTGGNRFGGTPYTPGTITPTANGDLCVSLMVSDLSGATATVSGAANGPYQAYVASKAIQINWAYTIQTTATAFNPSWGWTTGMSQNTAGTNACFKHA